MKVGNLPITIIVRDESEKHIRLHNFRGYGVRCAGNFFQWDTLDAFLEDDEFLYVLKEDVEEALRGNDLYRSFEYDFDANIGWSSTVPLGLIDEGFLETFNLNKTAFGKRVKSAYQDIRAPLTKTVTVTYELKCETDRGTQRDQLSVVIFSIHPGVDIGPLRGNMSQPRKDFPGCDFFGWDHPGQ
jgi:hypothetical protein